MDATSIQADHAFLSYSTAESHGIAQSFSVSWYDVSQGDITAPGPVFNDEYVFRNAAMPEQSPLDGWDEAFTSIGYSIPSFSIIKSTSAPPWDRQWNSGSDTGMPDIDFINSDSNKKLIIEPQK